MEFVQAVNAIFPIAVAKNEYKRQPDYIPPFAHRGNYSFPAELDQEPKEQVQEIGKRKS
jgi:hypothetical protein